jgi:hypothetical protein
MKRLICLCNAVQTICPQGSLTLTGVPEDPDQNTWKGTISIGCMILAESTGTLEEVITDLTKKLKRMSQRLLLQLAPFNPPDDGLPPSSRS